MAAALPELTGIAADAFDNVLCETVVMHLDRDAIDNAGNLGDAIALPAERVQPPLRVGQRSVRVKIGRIGGVAGDLHQTAHAVRPSDHAQLDAAIRHPYAAAAIVGVALALIAAMVRLVVRALKNAFRDTESALTHNTPPIN